MPRSPGLQAVRRQGVTAVWMAALPVPHWQAWSVRAQPATEMAEVRQGIWEEEEGVSWLVRERNT